MANYIADNQNITEPKFEANNSFAKQVDDVLSGADTTCTHLKVMGTPLILRQLGAQNIPVLMTAKHLKNIVEESGDKKNVNYHGVEVDLIKKLPELLSDPVMVMDSLTRDDSVVIVTSAVDKENRPILGAIKFDEFDRQDGKIIEATILLSVYGRNHFNEFIQHNLNENTVLYWDKEKSQELIKTPGLQLPDNLNSLTTNTIIRKANFVNVKRTKRYKIKSQVENWEDWYTDSIKNKRAREAAEWLIENNYENEDDVKSVFYDCQTSSMSDDFNAEKNDERAIISVANEYKARQAQEQAKQVDTAEQVGQAEQVNEKETIQYDNLNYSVVIYPVLGTNTDTVNDELKEYVYKPLDIQKADTIIEKISKKYGIDYENKPFENHLFDDRFFALRFGIMSEKNNDLLYKGTVDNAADKCGILEKMKITEAKILESEFFNTMEQTQARYNLEILIPALELEKSKIEQGQQVEQAKCNGIEKIVIEKAEMDKPKNEQLSSTIANQKDYAKYPLMRPEVITKKRADSRAYCLYIPTTSDFKSERKDCWVSASQVKVESRDGKAYVTAISKQGAMKSEYLTRSLQVQFARNKKEQTANKSKEEDILE